jgi:hypothetical protein
MGGSGAPAAPGQVLHCCVHIASAHKLHLLDSLLLQSINVTHSDMG